MLTKRVIPMEIKKAKGTYRKDRDTNPPPASKGKPNPPGWLNPDAKKKFRLITKRLDELGMASSSYTEMIAMLASRLEEVERLSKYLDAEGMSFNGVTRDGSDYFKPRPEVLMRDQAMKHAHKLLVEFGLSSSAIQRVGTPKTNKKKSNFDGF